jgi:hypothetical protein
MKITNEVILAAIPNPLRNFKTDKKKIRVTFNDVSPVKSKKSINAVVNGKTILQRIIDFLNSASIKIHTQIGIQG